MVNNRVHPKDVNRSNGRQLTLRRSAEDFEAGDATRRDYPVQSSLEANGKFRVIEKPHVIEAYTISLVSLSTPAVGGSIFTSCLKLLATSSHSEHRIRNYPTQIVVFPGDKSNIFLGTSVLVKRLILFKQETSLLVKHNCQQDCFKSYSSNHIRTVSVCETNFSNIVMFTTDGRKPCYLADENNQCDCRQFLEQIPCERHFEKISEKPRERPSERSSEKSCVRPCRKPCELSPQVQMHICMFCGLGFTGGNSCGKVCDQFLKNNDLKNDNLKNSDKTKIKPPKKRIRFCGCLKKKEKSEELEECEELNDGAYRIRSDRNHRLFARMKKTSELYIKKPHSAKEQSLNVISCKKSLKTLEEPKRDYEPISQSYGPMIQQEPECPYPQYYPPVNPCPLKCIPPCPRKMAPCKQLVYQDKPPCGHLERSVERPNHCLCPLGSSCGYPLVSQEKHSPPGNYLVVSQEKFNHRHRYLGQEKMGHICRCKPPESPESVTSPCEHIPAQPACPDTVMSPCGYVPTSPVCPETMNPPCGHVPASPVCSEKETPPHPGNSPPSVCEDKIVCLCKCHKYCRLKSTSKVQIKDYTYKSKSERLVGKRFHLLCQKFESSSEETDTSTMPDKTKSPAEEEKKLEHKKESTQESTELSEEVIDEYHKTNETEKETKVGRVEINYCKSYYPFKARLHRDNVPFKNQNNSLRTHSSSKPKHHKSSSNSSFSFLNLGRKKFKRLKYPIQFEDCRSCYLKVCKDGNKKKTVFCYSSGCSIKTIP